MTRARGKHTKARATTPVGQEARVNRLRAAGLRANRRADELSEAQDSRGGCTFSGAYRPDASYRPDAG